MTFVLKHGASKVDQANDSRFKDALRLRPALAGIRYWPHAIIAADKQDIFRLEVGMDDLEPVKNYGDRSV